MKNYSWKRRLFLSYIFIGVIPILVLGAFFYYGNRQSSKQETERNNLAQMSQVLQKMDYITEKMNTAAYHFSGTNMEKELREVRDNGKVMDDGNVISQLATYSEIIGNSDEEGGTFLFLYLRGDRDIYTMDGKTAYMDFEQSMREYGDLNSKSFYTIINSTKKDLSLRVGGEGESFRENSMVYFLYPVPYMNSIPIATLGFGFDSDDLKKVIKTYYTVDSNIFIFNEMQQNIFTYIKAGTDEGTAERLEKLVGEYRRSGGKMMQERLDGINYIIVKDISANSGITILTITEENDFYRTKDTFALWYIFLIGILVFGGIILSLILSKTNYQPIGRLFEKIIKDDILMKEETSRGNEFEIITSRWDDIYNKTEELNALINRQRPMVVASCLKRLLKGRYRTREEMDGMLKSANINLGYRYSFVFLLPFSADGEYEEDKSISILSVLSNDVKPFAHIYGLDMLKDEGIAIIVNCEEKDAGADKRDIRIVMADNISQRLKMAYGIDIPFYAGRIYEDLMDINRSFLEATAIAADYNMLGTKKIILFEEIGHEEHNVQYPVLEQALYIQCLKQANEEAALKALENMIKEIEPLKSFIITQCLCFDIINITIKTIDQLKGFELKNVDLRKVANFTNLAEFQDKITGLASEICRQFAEFKDNRNNELKTGILDYVNQHFNDNNLGLESVAEEFTVSANYLSRFFKQETGCSFIQYVTMLRMDRARELLVNTDKQIKDIVADIGYIDVANFVRKFKNYEGITPGQYRERMRRNME